MISNINGNTCNINKSTIIFPHKYKNIARSCNQTNIILIPHSGFYNSLLLVYKELAEQKKTTGNAQKNRIKCNSNNSRLDLSHNHPESIKENVILNIFFLQVK